MDHATVVVDLDHVAILDPALLGVQGVDPQALGMRLPQGIHSLEGGMCAGDKVRRHHLEWILRAQWIAEQLSDRLGIGKEFRESRQTRDDWMREMVTGTQSVLPDFPSLEEFKKIGIYKLEGGDPFVAFAEFAADPVANPLPTQTGKIEVYSPYLASLNNPEEIPAIPAYVPEWEGVSDPLREKYPLQMMTTHFVARAHSTFENVDTLREAHPQCLWINSVDAAKRGIKNGDMVKVYNDRGIVHIPAYVTNRSRPGVANMPEGAHDTPNADGVDIRGCGNTLTSHRPTPFAKGATFHTMLVQVEKL